MLRFLHTCSPLFFGLLFILSSSACAEDVAEGWKKLAKGMDFGRFKIDQQYMKNTSQTPRGSAAVITILRADLAHWQMKILSAAGKPGSKNMSAKQWANKYNLTAAINAGMFHTDYKTHIGLMISAEKEHNKTLNHYQSIAVFAANSDQLKPFQIVDLDDPKTNLSELKSQYGALLQNLRLIKKPGNNRWSTQVDKMWSEAALAEDSEGRILFIHSRTPLTMHAFNQQLLQLGIGVVAAQHLEGGPEAQMYVSYEDTEIELVGSYETSFTEHNNNLAAWPVPNVIGLVTRKKTDDSLYK